MTKLYCITGERNTVLRGGLNQCFTKQDFVTSYRCSLPNKLVPQCIFLCVSALLTSLEQCILIKQPLFEYMGATQREDYSGHNLTQRDQQRLSGNTDYMNMWVRLDCLLRYVKRLVRYTLSYKTNLIFS